MAATAYLWCHGAVQNDPYPALSQRSDPGRTHPVPGKTNPDLPPWVKGKAILPDIIVHVQIVIFGLRIRVEITLIQTIKKKIVGFVG